LTRIQWNSSLIQWNSGGIQWKPFVQLFPPCHIYSEILWFAILDHTNRQIRVLIAHRFNEDEIFLQNVNENGWFHSQNMSHLYFLEK
jgi:hypothetical protein